MQRLFKPSHAPFSLVLDATTRPGAFGTRLGALAALALGAASAHAQFPLQDMGLNRLSVGYGLLASGQNITEKNIASQQLAHSLVLGYAPLPYAGLALGLGLAEFNTRSSTSASGFRGDYAFSPSLALRLATPAFVHDQLRVIGGLSGQYLLSKDGRGVTYSARVLNPDLGLQYSPFSFLDLALGGRMHFLDGEITLRNSNAALLFANETVIRGFLGATFKSPSEGAFFSLDLDLSPEIDANWSRGPVEASIRATLGTVLNWRSREPKAAPRNPYFPHYKELKDRQEQMSDQLEAD